MVILELLGSESSGTFITLNMYIKNNNNKKLSIHLKKL